MSRYLEQIQRYCRAGLYSREQLERLADCGAITPEELEQLLTEVRR